MAEKKPPNKPKGGAAAGKVAYTTLRLYAEDGDDLSALADLKRTTIADLYRELFADKVRKLRIEETNELLKKLKEPGGSH